MADEPEDDQTGQNSGQEDQVPDEPRESNSQQDNAGRNPPAMVNALPGNAKSNNGPPVNRKDMSSNGDKSLVTKLKESENLRYAAVGVVAGTAAVVAAPLVLSAVGFTAGGVAAGSTAAAIQSTFYGGYVASGSAFALAQSAGAAGIGAAGNAAIGGFFGGITAFGAKMFNKLRTDIKLLICGWGSEARVFALNGTEVRVRASLNGTEVRVLEDRRNAQMLTNDLTITFHRRGGEPTFITSKPALVTNNPKDAMQDVDIVVFMLPASAHEVFLDTLKPYIKPGTLIVGLPGGPVFEFLVHDVLGDVGRQCTIMNFESSAWVCRTTEFGDCEVLGTMETLLGAIKQGKDVAPKKDPVSTLQYLLGPLPKLIVSEQQQ